VRPQPISELLTAFKTAFNVIPDLDWLEMDCWVFLLFITLIVKGAVKTLVVFRIRKCKKFY